ncbi:hypothetical protein DYB32_008687 [Aphanomyces invadans]|uniref:Uncharacterized protein n=1 Tax=Aphanomyces invadans TaxID=157072 RepID=A0A3R6YTI9_9STRA|nr:hypothetical protein DYB32_008687 [Aphanomyces invadans]
MVDGLDNSKLLSYEAFEGACKQPKAYHAMFNHAYFVGWLQRLLDDVAALQECNAIIVFDNAKCHKVLPDDPPAGSWTKARMMQACATYGIELDVNEYRSTLWAKWPWIADITSSSRRRITVTYNLSMIWSYVKGAVGLLYDTSTTFFDVCERFDHEFGRLPSSVIFDCIDHIDRKVVKMAAYLDSIDEAEDAAGTPYSSDSEIECDGDSCDDGTLGDYEGDE